MALDHVELPQRPRAVERARHDPRDLVGELVVGARRGQRHLAHVVAEVELGLVDPVGIVEPERHLGSRQRNGGSCGARSASSRVTSPQPKLPPGAVDGSSIARLPTWPVWRAFSRARNCASRLVSCRMPHLISTVQSKCDGSPREPLRRNPSRRGAARRPRRTARRVPPPARRPRLVRDVRAPRHLAQGHVHRSPRPGHQRGDLPLSTSGRASTGRCSWRATPTRCPSRRSTRRSAVFCAHGLDVRVDAADGYTPTPALSHAILTHPGSDGIVLTPSHNPPEDGGYKYNPPSGGPAGTDITKAIEGEANRLIEADSRRSPPPRRRPRRTTTWPPTSTTCRT